MNVQGKLIEIYESKQITDKFKKREFVIEYAENPQYPQYIKFELTQNNCDMIDQFSKNDFVDVSFDLRGKPWTNKDGVTTYFTSLAAWKIQKSDSPHKDEENQEPHFENSGDDDLPF
jgi:hypothetical protein